eukprot:70794-Pelagomonas_calceolata.AAC.1
MGIWKVASHAPGCPDFPVLHRLAPSKLPPSPPNLGPLRDTRGVGLPSLYPADQQLVEHSHPASKIETISGKFFENLYES